MISRQELHNPTMRERPKIRWWLPGAFIEPDEVRREIRALANAGYGGAEIIYFFGVPSADVSPDEYDQYFFGSERWNRCMKAALETAVSLDFKLDFTVGPAWPIATPAITDINDDRANCGLHIATMELAADRGYDGPLPLPDTLDMDRPYRLVAVTLANTAGEPGPDGSALYDAGSARAITGGVDVERISLRLQADGLIPVQASASTVFAYYSQTSMQINVSCGAPVVDHFNRAATDAVIAYWEDVLMGDAELRSLYERDGGDLFCDSIELNATMLGGMYDAKPLPVILWTPSFLQEFHARRGYNLLPYLQAVFVPGLFQHSGSRNLDGLSRYEFSDAALGRRIRRDYFQTMTDLLNENHIAPLRDWAHRHSMRLRYQVYGPPTEMTESLHFVDVPESESWGSHDSTEMSRLLAGAVHMEHKPVYSYELGALPGKAYEQLWTGDKGLLWQAHQGAAAGINQNVLHGMSYESRSATGPMAAGFRWPGLSVMGLYYSNEWGERQPVWRHSHVTTGYLARLQTVLQRGRPRVDVAVYRHEYEGANIELGLEPTMLQLGGYTYDYVSPWLLSLLPRAVSNRDGVPVLDGDGAAYRALVVGQRLNREKNIYEDIEVAVEELAQILSLADNGLPVFWVGEVRLRAPFAPAGENSSRLQQMSQALQQHRNVRFTSEDLLCGVLREVGISPAMNAGPCTSLVSVRRADEDADYYFLYNNTGGAIQKSVELAGKGVPSVLNCWDGSMKPIVDYQATACGVRMTIELEPGGVIVVAIGPIREDSHHQAGGRMETTKLENWSLTVDSYLPGSTPAHTEHRIIRLERVELKPWLEIGDLAEVSGIGVYATDVEIDLPVLSARLRYGWASDTAICRINGVEIAIDLINRAADVKEALHTGTNHIEIEVATALSNALAAAGQQKARQPFGLTGPVLLDLVH